jgi:hypothetical protein
MASFSGICKVRELKKIWVYEMLKLSIIAQGSRLIIIVVVQVGAVKIYVAAAAAVQALREKETEDETQFTTKIGRKN